MRCWIVCSSAIGPSIPLGRRSWANWTVASRAACPIPRKTAPPPKADQPRPSPGTDDPSTGTRASNGTSTSVKTTSSLAVPRMPRLSQVSSTRTPEEDAGPRKLPRRGGHPPPAGTAQVRLAVDRIDQRPLGDDVLVDPVEDLVRPHPGLIDTAD